MLKSNTRFKDFLEHYLKNTDEFTKKIFFIRFSKAKNDDEFVELLQVEDFKSDERIGCEFFRYINITK